VVCDLEDFKFLCRQLLSGEEILGGGATPGHAATIGSANLGVTLSICAEIIDNKNAVTKIMDLFKIVQQWGLLHVPTGTHCGLRIVKTRLGRLSLPLHLLPDADSTGVKSPKTFPCGRDVKARVSSRKSQNGDLFWQSELS
jgi:hypothetical protein